MYVCLCKHVHVTRCMCGVRGQLSSAIPCLPTMLVRRFLQHADCVGKPESWLLSFRRFLGPPPIYSTQARVTEFDVSMSGFYVGPGHELRSSGWFCACFAGQSISSGPHFILKHSIPSNYNTLGTSAHHIAKKGLICKTSKECRQLNGQNPNHDKGDTKIQQQQQKWQQGSQ